MPAKSKAQQRFMGMVHALKKGDIKPSDASAEVRKAAKSMKKKSVKDYATTKHKSKPEKVKSESTKEYGKSIEKIANDRKLKSISKKDRATLIKIAKLMKKYNESTNEERDYKAEYKKFQSSTKAKKYRAELNQYNRKKGTYGNGDGKDASHKGGKIVGFEKESKNRGRAEKSRLKKEVRRMVREIINESTKRQYRDVYRKYYKTYEAFARELMNLAKSVTKISGDRTDERVILKNFKKQVIPFAGLMNSWSKGRESNPHIDESVTETIELIKKDNPKYKARLHQVKLAFKLAKVKLTSIKPIKARKGVVPKGHYDKSGDRLAPAWAITATDGKNTKSGEVIFQDGNDPGFYIDKDYMGLNPNNKNKIPRNIQRWMIGKKAHHSKGVDESVNEGGMGVLTSDQADVLQGIVMRNKNKNLKGILNVALKSGYFKGVDKKELLGYIDGAKQFVKYMKSHPMESIKEEKQELNEELTTKLQPPSDVSYYSRDWEKVFKSWGDVDYGPRESDMYDWNVRQNYTAVVKEFNAHMTKVAKKLNVAVRGLDDASQKWRHLMGKHRRKDRS